MEGNYNYSISDLATVANAGFGNNGGNSFWFIILFFLIFNNGGWNRGNYGTGEFGQFATAASQNEILLGQKFSDLDNKIDRGFTSIGNGISDATFALNNNIKDTAYATTNAVKDTAYATSGAVVSEGRALQAQLAQCCCDNKQATAQVRYDMANFAASINSNIDNKFAALEKNQMQAQIDAQAREINQLYIAQQMCGVVRWPNNMSYMASGSPFCNYNGGGCGCSCN